MKVNVEFESRFDSSGECIRLEFPHGRCVVVYPNTDRGSMIVNIATPDVCLASVVLDAQNTLTVHKFD